MYSQYNKHTHNEIVVGTGRKQRGTVLVFVVLTLITIFSFAALAIDVGYLFVVRNELQNAADATALTIASHLYPLNGTEPNWSAAQTHEQAAIALNKAAGAQLADGTVEYGYWNISGSPTGLQSISITTGANDLPAVKVTIRKASGQNGGGVATFFAKVLGINTLDARAIAVAVVANPGYTKASLMPISIPSCIYNSEYWDSSAGAPTTPPTTFSLGSTVHYDGCGGTIEAQWTSLNTGANSTTEIRNLIDYATGTGINPDQPQLAIGSDIHIEPGVKNTLYDTPTQTSVNGCSAAGDKTCEYALLPVVDQICTNCDTAIQGFACVHILSATGSPPDKGTIDIQLVAMGSAPECKMDNSGGTGTNYGAYLPPKLANYSGNTY